MAACSQARLELLLDQLRPASAVGVSSLSPAPKVAGGARDMYGNQWQLSHEHGDAKLTVLAANAGGVSRGPKSH